MEQLTTAPVTVGGLVLGLLSDPVRRSVLSGPLVTLLVGVLLGPRILGLLDPTARGRQKLLLGLALPWEGWAALGWHAPLLVVVIRLLRRAPPATAPATNPDAPRASAVPAAPPGSRGRGRS